MKKQIFLILLFVWILVHQSFAVNNPDKEVLNAFELPTKGRVDDSRKLLESILSKDSTNAMAHYEMARLKHYLLIGGGAIKIDDIGFNFIAGLLAFVATSYSGKLPPSSN